jgi:glycyl-tRNA synthetase beta chain
MRRSSYPPAPGRQMPAALFRSAIGDLISHPKVAETRHHIHHSIPKHDHLLRSARYSFQIAGVLGADRWVCARAAILHDLDSRLGSLSGHGAIAARLASEMGEPEAVCQAIVPHMFPLGPRPTSREGWVLAIADKMASLSDLTHFVLGLFSGSLQRRRRLRATDPYVGAKRRQRRA